MLLLTLSTIGFAENSMCGVYLKQQISFNNTNNVCKMNKRKEKIFLFSLKNFLKIFLSVNCVTFDLKSNQIIKWEKERNRKEIRKKKEFKTL